MSLGDGRVAQPHSFYETTARRAAYTHILARFDIMPAEKYHTTEVICE